MLCQGNGLFIRKTKGTSSIWAVYNRPDNRRSTLQCRQTRHAATPNLLKNLHRVLSASTLPWQDHEIPANRYEKFTAPDLPAC
jgi:hypothetical protein